MKKIIGRAKINKRASCDSQSFGFQAGGEAVIKYNKQKNCSLRRGCAGFTMIEILVIVAIVAAIALFGGLNLYGVLKGKALENDAAEIAFSLRAAREKAVSQEDGNQWGAHFENPAGNSGFYAVFSGATFIPGASVIHKNLSASVQFINPAPGNSLDIIFSKVYGLPSSGASIIIALKSDVSKQKIISINQNGEVQY